MNQVVWVSSILRTERKSGAYRYRADVVTFPIHSERAHFSLDTDCQLLRSRLRRGGTERNELVASTAKNDRLISSEGLKQPGYALQYFISSPVPKAVVD